MVLKRRRRREGKGCLEKHNIEEGWMAVYCMSVLCGDILYGGDIVRRGYCMERYIVWRGILCGGYIVRRLPHVFCLSAQNVFCAGAILYVLLST